MKFIVGFLRQVGCHLIVCLDDLLILHHGKVQLQQIISSISQLFVSLGLIINQKKSILYPTQKIGILGFEILPQSMTLLIPSEEDPTGCLKAFGSEISVSERDSPICRESYSYNQPWVKL